MFGRAEAISSTRSHTSRRLADRDSVLGEAWRAVYTSVSGVDGGGREVSGAFFVPRGTPPENGWPVISFAHGTTGIGNNCGPSRAAEFQGYGPTIESFLADKYAVAVSDYEGLGESGSHPYLEPRTAALTSLMQSAPCATSHQLCLALGGARLLAGRASGVGRQRVELLLRNRSSATRKCRAGTGGECDGRG